MKGRYEVIIDDVLNAYVKDNEENEIVVLCNTKRPDKEFTNLKKLVEYANQTELLKKKINGSVNDNSYLESLREIDTHIRSTKEPIPYIVKSLKNILPEYQE